MSLFYNAMKDFMNRVNLKDLWVFFYHISSDSVQQDPNLERMISLYIPVVLTTLKKLQQPKLTQVFTL